MTSRLLITKKDTRRSDFVLVGDTSVGGANPGSALYTSDTTHYTHPRNGARATTTITRADPTCGGDRFQVGVIEWPVDGRDPVQLVVGTRDVHMSKLSVYTSCVRLLPLSGSLFTGVRSERFLAADGLFYEWQIHDAHPQVRSSLLLHLTLTSQYSLSPCEAIPAPPPPTSPPSSNPAPAFASAANTHPPFSSPLRVFTSSTISSSLSFISRVNGAIRRAPRHAPAYLVASDSSVP